MPKNTGLRLLEDQETRLASLRAALIEGENSGPATPFDFDAFLASKREPDAPLRDGLFLEATRRA